MSNNNNNSINVPRAAVYVITKILPKAEIATKAWNTLTAMTLPFADKVPNVLSKKIRDISKSSLFTTSGFIGTTMNYLRISQDRRQELSCSHMLC